MLAPIGDAARPTRIGNIADRTITPRSMTLGRQAMFKSQTSFAALLLACYAAPALAQAPYPNRPITVVVPAAPGATDVLWRELAQPLSERLGQPIVVENRAGAATLIGTQNVAKAEPDGYRLLFTTSSLTIIQNVLKNPGIDVRTNLVPVSRTIQGLQALYASSAAPFNNVREFINHAKANPGKLNYASSGIGSLIHVTMELLKMSAGIDVVHISYQSGAPAMTALIANEVQVTTYDASLAAQQIQAGKIKMLGVLSKNRAPQYPDMPAVAETLPGVAVTYWYGLLAPAGTPQPIIDRWYRELSTVVKQPNIIASFTKRGYLVGATSPDEFRAEIASEVEQWARVVKQANIPQQ